MASVVTLFLVPIKGSKQMSNRDTYKYHYKEGNRIIRSGITDDLERREGEHQQENPRGHITQVGRRTTEEAARSWEDKQPKGTPPGGG